MTHLTSMLPLTVCLLCAIFINVSPPLVSATRTERYYSDPSQSDILLSDIAQSQRQRGAAEKSNELQQLKNFWNQHVVESEGMEKVRRRSRPNLCNPVTGRCSAGWKRSPSLPRQDLTEFSYLNSGAQGGLPTHSTANTDQSKRRASSRVTTPGKTRTDYGRSIRRSKCNQLNGRCSAGWKRASSASFGGDKNHYLLNKRSSLRESVFDILDRLEN